MSLLCKDNVESRARRGKSLEKRAGGFACYCMEMFCEMEFGIEHKTELSDMGTPRNSSILILCFRAS